MRSEFKSPVTWAACVALATLACAGVAQPNTPPGRAPQATGFVVVINAENPVTSLTSEEVSRLFLRKVSTWADGSAVAPVDQEAESEARLAFTSVILRRKPAAVRAYWQQRIFSGRDVPPPVCGSDAEVMRFVAENPGAIGYVSPDAAPSGQVRIVAVTGVGR